jgi:hypothetical protein
MLSTLIAILLLTAPFVPVPAARFPVITALAVRKRLIVSTATYAGVLALLRVLRFDRCSDRG